MNNQYVLRTHLLFLLFCGGYLFLIGALYRIQIIKHAFFKELAQQQYQITLTIAYPRAPIFDRSGLNYLAMNKESLSAFILPQQLKEKAKVKKFLQEHFPAAYQRLQQKEHKKFMFVARHLTSAQQQLIKQYAPADIKLIKEPSRYYPLHAAASTLVGLTDIDNQGIMGIEFYYNQVLQGSPIKAKLQKDARSGNFYFDQSNAQDGVSPQALQTTIDSNLQFLVHETLQQALQKYNAQEGGAIIIDPKNGDILALVNVPSFDANNIALVKNKNDTINHVISSAYEFGSVMKVFAALAALEEKVVTFDELIDCQNSKSTYIDGRPINTVAAHGVIPFWQVIALSNNIGIAIVAKRLDTLLYDHYIKLGFGSKPKIGLPAQAKGFVNPPEHWSAQSIISLSYGYEVSTTLALIAQAFCTIAHNGQPVRLRILLSDTVEIGQPLYRPASIEQIKDILEATTLHGTTKRARIKGYKIMSKTGTANMLINGKYEPGKNIFTCAGIVEKDDYQRVVVLYIKETERPDLFAAGVAAPLFEKVVEQMLIHERIIN